MDIRAFADSMGKDERAAWIAAVAFGLVSACVGWTLFGAPAGRAGEVGGLAEAVRWFAVVLALVVAWAVRPDAEALDEHDRHLMSRSGNAAARWLGFCLLVMALACDMDSLRGYVVSRSPEWIKIGVLFVMLSSIAVGACAHAVLHWRDRR
ncbi:hypothetical protein Psesu_2241 [Pseudoxanthomonas suwonensis 11-1]|uniref:Transmembrane protein n=1 Tax=Pseudoxanthomonas suwonensis (strain 11-1) TaxID=743721 RepID=E6WV76_PSEUU|nr:hypothetical protein [Pseudoxanthomonas suwonensis]ADV28075.1 hypothetical protein Psesu_2241 [Pseudoxanthomonas suwonensis 11-1]